MRYSLLTIILIIVSCAASAQWRPNPYYFYFKGLKADSVLIVPRDTIQANAGAEPDVGRIAYKNGVLWFRDATQWLAVQTGNLPIYRKSKTYTVDGGEPGDPEHGDTVLIDSSLDGWQFEVFRPSLGRFMWYGVEWVYRPGGGIELIYPGDMFYGPEYPERIDFIFYPKGVTILTN